MSLIKSFSTYAFGAMATLLIGFVTTPVVTRLVNPAEMGEYSLFVTVATVAATALYFGLDQSYARFYAKTDRRDRPSLLGFCMVFPVAFSALLLIACLPFSGHISAFLVGRPQVKVYFLLGVYLVNMVLNRFLIVDIRMRQKAGLYSLLNCLRKVSYFVLALAFYYLVSGDDSLTLIAAITGAEIVLLAFSVGSVFSQYKGAQWFSWNKLQKRDIVMFGLPFILSTSIDELFHSTDKLLLGMMSNYYEVGIYTAAYSMVAIVGVLRTTFSSFWLPVAYEHFESSPHDLDFYERVNQIVTALMALLTAVLVLFKDVVVQFLGGDYIQATTVFPLLLFVPLMFTMSEVTMTGINLMGRTKHHASVSIVCLTINVVGNIFLIPILGSVGAALSTAITYVIFYVLRSYYANKCLKIPYSFKKTALVLALLSLFVGYSTFCRIDPIAVFLFAILLGAVVGCYRKTLLYLLKSLVLELRSFLS